MASVEAARRGAVNTRPSSRGKRTLEVSVKALDQQRVFTARSGHTRIKITPDSLSRSLTLGSVVEYLCDQTGSKD